MTGSCNLNRSARKSSPRTCLLSQDLKEVRERTLIHWGGGGGQRREIASRKSQKSEEKKGQESASLRGLPKVSQGLTQLTF